MVLVVATVHVALLWLLVPSAQATPPDGREVGVVRVGGAPYDVVAAPDDATLWVSNAGSGTVQAIDAQRLTINGTVPVPSSPHGLAFTPDGRELWVASIDANAVSVIDPTQARLLVSMPAGARPHVILIGP